MPLKSFDVPKYAQLVTTLQERMTDGTYAQGAMLPSETQLMEDFHASRPIVVRALGILQQDGWIDAEQGRGRFVRRTQPIAATMGAGRDLFRPERAATVKLLDVGVVEAPMRAAYALGLDEAMPVIARRRLVTSASRPIELSTIYLPLDLADHTKLTEPQPLRDGVLAYLAQHCAVAWSHATDRIGGRLPTAEECRLLDIGRRDVVLTILATAYDTTGTPRLAADAVMPTVRAELEDSFPLS